MFGGGIEGFMLKWTLGIAFIGITLIFIAKICMLLGAAASIKATALLAKYAWIKELIQMVTSK